MCGLSRHRGRTSPTSGSVLLKHKGQSLVFAIRNPRDDCSIPVATTRTLGVPLPCQPDTGDEARADANELFFI